MCGLALLSLNNLAKHEKEERRERYRASFPSKDSGGGYASSGGSRVRTSSSSIGMLRADSIGCPASQRSWSS